MINKEFPLIHRDISWLSFNYRVLQEAKDTNTPLLERVKFLAIFSNNLDEFFRVRVANHKNLVRLGKKTKSQLYEDPQEILNNIIKIVDEQQLEFSDIFENQIVPELAEQKIYLKRREEELTEEQKAYIDTYFKDNFLPYVQPVLLKKQKIRPFLNNASLYLATELHDKVKSERKVDYAIVKIPSDNLSRFVKLPSLKGRHDIIILDDIVRQSLQWLFPGFDVLNSYSLKLTRDAELYIDDEYNGDLLEKIKSSLNRRNVGPASRIVYDREMPQEMLNYLMSVFELDDTDLLEEGRYHNNFDFFTFPDFGFKHLKFVPLPPLNFEPLQSSQDFWKTIADKDRLINLPYHSYESTIRFFEEAAKDPEVTHIKIVQYRVAAKSRIMDSLIQAANSGKQVSVFIEVKARFDEEANLKWGEKLEQAGIKVNYSFPGLKVHSKLALVRKVTDNKSKMYAYLSSGNFHEDTAKVYSDFGLFTADPRLTGEVARLFSFLETVQVPKIPFEHLLVGQFQLRPRLEQKINREINAAKAGKKAKMILKMNSLQDEKMIKKLYEASEAGVEIKLIIRGICSLIPQQEGYSMNITVISIVDRFLEHARVYHFHNEGNEEIYISSADWMVRNLSYRIEAVFPIYDKDLKDEIIDYLNIQLSDNVKARVITGTHSNEYVQNSSNLAIRSQIELYYYYKRKLENHLREVENQTI